MLQDSRIDRSMRSHAPWLVLSPHLDDAVLSCGALLEAEAPRRDIIVATLFTEATPAPHTRAARSFIHQCAATDAVGLFADRKAEDRAVLNAMGVQSVHLGAVDALFRQRTPPVIGSSAWDRLLPELTHRYPTYRFDIALGRIARGDRRLARLLQGDVDRLMSATGAELLFCPVGVGKHVDHLITRDMGAAYPENRVFYSDFPYDLASDPDRAHLASLHCTPWTWSTGLEGKQVRIRQYGTQADALFPDGEIPEKPETYFVPAAS